MSYRPLKSSEITALQQQGCFSSDWSKIRVTDPFITDSVFHVRFSGQVSLGKLGGPIKSHDGEIKTSGLYSCHIDSCEIGSDVLIDSVQLIKNYRINDRVTIERVQSISVNGSTSFGNGAEIKVLNEGGGRELLIYDKLTAQIAYILVSYRHNPLLIDSISRMIEEYSMERSALSGTIGSGVEILNTDTISDVHIGEGAMIRGATLLQNGTIASNREDPVYVGESVIARDFIFLSGSKVDSGAVVERSFVGQGVGMGKQFSAENSLFFANSEAFHGEAVSIFAGPYTVTHHKSSLLIAGMYSFYNAGSGTNQSNHMYKLGPVHQGIVERGSKTGSYAYLLWPCRIGAFSVITGKNEANFDTSDFPFSYITVEGGRSILTPGINLFTVGTRRDIEKWPARDRRRGPEKYDLINFNFLTPYTIQKVLNSLDIMQTLYEKASEKQESVFYKGVRIKKLMLKATRKYYEMALNIFVGSQLVKMLEKIQVDPDLETIQKELTPGSLPSSDKWIDMAGMISPRQRVQQLLDRITSGHITSLPEIVSHLEKINSSYEEDAWEWTTTILSGRFGIEVKQINTSQLLELVTLWESATIRLNRMILNDATKEFDQNSKIGFGIDGEHEVVLKDFEAVRGVFDENKFVTGIREEIGRTEKKASELKEMIRATAVS